MTRRSTNPKRINFLILFFLVLLSLLNSIKLSESNVESINNVFISTDTTWTRFNSPYVFNSIVVIETGATLTIESGVTIKFTSGFGMLVEGKLIAIGTIGQPITFTSNSSSPSIGDWDEVKLRSSLGNIFHFCIFEYANRGIAMSVSSEGIFNNCTFRYNNYGLYLSGSSGEVQYSAFLYNNYGIRSESSSQFTFTFNEIAHNNQFGIDARDKSTFTNNSIHHNVGFGIYLMSGNTHFLYNNITENIGGGISIWASSTSRIAFHFNNLINNTGYNAHREQGTPEINLSWNYWGTSNETEIQESIYDYYDDPVNRGKLNYQPYLNNSVEIFISFSDSRRPSIAIFNPSNNTSIDHNSIWLNFTIDEFTAWIGYSLDDNDNVTITGNTLLPLLSEGSHYITLYSNDTAGNMGISSVVWFTVDTFSPIIELILPQNLTYTERNVWLNFTVNEPTIWIGYSLNDDLNVTITGNTLLTMLPNGLYSVEVFATDETGNTGKTTKLWFTIDTDSPQIIIEAPLNKTIKNPLVWLNFSITESVSWIGYSLDNGQNVTITNNTFLGSLTEGSHTISVYANDSVNNMGHITVWLTIDSISPNITITNPTNTTFNEQNFWLNFTINEVVTWIGYSLDGTSNVTISGNTSVSSLSDDSHWIVIYASDSAGNEGISATIWFTVDTPSITSVIPPTSTIPPSSATSTSSTPSSITMIPAPSSTSSTQPPETKTSPTWTPFLLLVSFTVIILLRKMKNKNV